MPSPSYSPMGDVHLGFWTNQRLGNVEGATLTLDRRSGTLFISFLALFIGITGNGFWKIVRLCLYFSLSRESNPDGIYHQRQAVLRNSMSQDATIALVQACYAWRTRGLATLGRILPMALIAAILSVGFTVTGGLSSRFVLSKANEVLLEGVAEECDRPLPILIMTSNNASDTRFLNNEYLNYASLCYPPIEDDKTDGCTDYVQPYLTITNNTKASCPFSGDVCKLATGNLIVETGPLDTFEDLGMNMGPRVVFSHKMHCAPLKTEGFTEVTFDNATSSNWLSYKYGRRDGKFPYLNPVQINTTAPYSNVGDYRVSSISTTNAIRGNITLIPELNLTDAGTSILWLDSSTVYSKFKVDDPWFASNKPSHPPDLGYNTAPGDEWYTADEPRGVIGCANHFIYCNPDLPKETGCVNGNTPNAQNDMKRIWPNADDQALIRFLVVMLKPVQAGTIEGFYDTPSLPSIQRRDTIQGNRQVSDDVHSRIWQYELEYVFMAMLAAIQRNSVELANEYWPDGVPCPKDAPCKRPCQALRVRSALHYSFSVLIISLVFAIGGVILIISYSLELILDAAFKIPAFRDNHRLRFAYAEWQTGTTLQLLRLAHEGIGLGTWSGAIQAVPVTAAGDVLGVLDVSDKKHPRLVAPSAKSGEVIEVQPKQDSV